MKIIHSDIGEVRSMINALRASIKLRENFKAVARQLAASTVIRQTVHLPTYDTETRWSSIVHMLDKPYKACEAFQLTARRTDDLKEHYTAESSWTELK